MVAAAKKKADEASSLLKIFAKKSIPSSTKLFASDSSCIELQAKRIEGVNLPFSPECARKSVRSNTESLPNVGNNATSCTSDSGTINLYSVFKSPTKVVKRKSSPKKISIDDRVEALKTVGSSDFTINRRKFAGVVREIFLEVTKSPKDAEFSKDAESFKDIKVSRVAFDAITALQVISEAFVANFFEDLRCLANHAKRKTVMLKDVVTYCRMNHDPMFHSYSK